MSREQDRIRLAKAQGYTPRMVDYEYVWHQVQRKQYWDSPYDGDPEWEQVPENEGGFWRDEFTDNYKFRRKLPEPVQQGWILDGKSRVLPNPYEDANDDYAVLKWMQGRGWFNVGCIARHTTLSAEMFCYQVGDYARAALKVLDDE